MNEKEKKAFDIADACIKAAQEISNRIEKRKRWISVDFESYFDTYQIEILPSLSLSWYDGDFILRFSFIVFELQLTFSR